MRDVEEPLRSVLKAHVMAPRPVLHSQEHIGYRVLPTGRRRTIVRLVAECAQRVIVSVASVGGLYRRFRHRPSEAGLRGLYVRSRFGFRTSPCLWPRCEVFAQRGLGGAAYLVDNM